MRGIIGERSRAARRLASAACPCAVWTASSPFARRRRISGRRTRPGLPGLPCRGRSCRTRRARREPLRDRLADGHRCVVRIASAEMARLAARARAACCISISTRRGPTRRRAAKGTRPGSGPPHERRRFSPAPGRCAVGRARRGPVAGALVPALARACWSLSLTDYQFGMGGFAWVGLDNYARMFADPRFLQSLGQHCWSTSPSSRRSSIFAALWLADR